MTDDDLTKLVDQMAERWGMGGIDTGTMYGQFALEVAKEVRERCAKLCEDCDTFEYDDPGGFFARLIRSRHD